MTMTMTMTMTMIAGIATTDHFLVESRDGFRISLEVSKNVELPPHPMEESKP